MSLFQQEYSFKGIVFTTSHSLISFCESKNITVIQRISRNEFGLPYVRDMLIELKARYNSSYYGYMNSDILLNPNIISTLKGISDRINRKQYPTTIGITCTVKEVDNSFNSSDFDTMNSTRLQFKKNYTRSRMRGSSAKVKIIQYSIIGFIYISTLISYRETYSSCCRKDTC